jgi:hypothetical protein
MAPPFTSEQFFAVFSEYNRAVWPLQVVLFALALASVFVALRRPGIARLILGYLAVLWVWMGIAYHWLFFSAINPAARVFGGLFVIEGALLAWMAVSRRDLAVEPKADVAGITGGLLLGYALILYPMLGWSAGHRYPAQPTFGLPCPTTIYTVGMLLWLNGRLPWQVLVVPVLWALVGTSAVRFFGVLEDAALPLAAVVGASIIVLRNRRMLVVKNP